MCLVLGLTPWGSRNSWGYCCDSPSPSLSAPLWPLQHPPCSVSWAPKTRNSSLSLSPPSPQKLCIWVCRPACHSSCSADSPVSGPPRCSELGPCGSPHRPPPLTFAALCGFGALKALHCPWDGPAGSRRWQLGPADGEVTRVLGWAQEGAQKSEDLGPRRWVAGVKKRRASQDRSLLCCDFLRAGLAKHVLGQTSGTLPSLLSSRGAAHHLDGGLKFCFLNFLQTSLPPPKARRKDRAPFVPPGRRGICSERQGSNLRLTDLVPARGGLLSPQDGSDLCPSTRGCHPLPRVDSAVCHHQSRATGPTRLHRQTVGSHFRPCDVLQ